MSVQKRDRTLSVIPLLMIAAGIFLIAGSAFWMANQPVDAVVVSSTINEARTPFSDVPRINVEDAKSALDRGSAIFIDTRGDPYFSQGHIPDALSVTEDELPGRLDEFDPTDWIILYCT